VNQFTLEQARRRQALAIATLYKGSIAMPSTNYDGPAATKDYPRKPENPPRDLFARPARQTQTELYQAPAFIVPDTGFCIYIAYQR
jgi:hypothetical protein